MLTLGVMASGNLGLRVLQHLNLSYPIKFVMTDKASIAIINYCEKIGIPCFCGNPRNNNAKPFLKNLSIDVLVSINYLFIIEKDVIQHANKLAFNVHGSLLPKYRGRTPHVWAIINGEKDTGITAHLIEEGCDTGGIIEQMIIPIEEYDTGADILRKYEKEYIPLVHNVLKKIETGNLTITLQDSTRASFFGKRTPHDGKVNWDWQRERIRNWIRAQAAPYPGAFVFYKGYKIIIDEVEYSDLGFNNDMPNGLILCASPLIVKASNGAMRISKLRESNITFEVNNILN